MSQAFTALSTRRGGALGQTLSRLEPQVGMPSACHPSHGEHARGSFCTSFPQLYLHQILQ